jgi:hypothetical protein
MLHSHQLEYHVGIAVQSDPTDLSVTVMFCAYYMIPFIHIIPINLTAEKITYKFSENIIGVIVNLCLHTFNFFCHFCAQSGN